MRYLSKKILLFLIVYLVFISHNPLQASCNNKEDSGVIVNITEDIFQIHGTEQNRYVIEGDCFEEFLKAMGNEKEIDIEYAEIKGRINFANSKFFSFSKFNDYKNSNDRNDDEIKHIENIYGTTADPRIVLFKRKITITKSIIAGNISVLSDIQVLCIFRKTVNFEKTRFLGKEVDFKGSMFKATVIFDKAYFRGKADFTNTTFKEYANFIEAKFKTNVEFKSGKFNSGVKFNRAKFDDTANFRDTKFHKLGLAYFENTKFNAEAYFSRAMFDGDTNFSEAEFDGIVDFKQVNFNFPDFRKTSFKKSAIFRQAEFYSGAYFSHAGFDDTANFCNTKFHKKGLTYFENTKFNAEAYFIDTIFTEEVHFENATFLKKADFSNARFDNEAFFEDAKFSSEANFPNTKFNASVNFIKSTLSAGANFNNAEFFEGVSAIFSLAEFGDTANFRGTKFHKMGLADFKATKFNALADFSNAKFGSEAYFGDVEFYGETKFTEAEFDKTASFNCTKFLGGDLAHFEKAKFNAWAIFSNAEFLAETRFDYTVFHATTEFNDTRFYDKVYFKNVMFDKVVSFENARFEAEAYFSRSIFKTLAIFDTANFLDNCFFIKVVFGVNSIYAGRYLTKENIKDIIIRDAKDVNVKKVIDQNWTLKKEELSPFIVDLIRAYRAAINKKIDFNLPVEKLLPHEKVEVDKECKLSFNSTDFNKYVDFKNTLFFADVDFREASFKEVGLFDNSFFFNARALGLVDKNDKDSMIGLDFDRSYFNLLKGFTFNQIFPHLHKRIKYYDEEEETRAIETIKEQSIDNYKYFQKNFKKIGNYEDADKIYYERKQLEAENEKRFWKKYWNWCLDKTCRYGTDFKQIVKVSIILIIAFTLLYFLAFVPPLGEFFGVIEIKDKDKWIEREELSDIWGSKSTKEQKDSKIIKLMFKHLWYSFYLSVNTFTTLGTGDIIATRFLRVLIIIEGTMGWFILGLFIVVLSSKYFR